MTARPRLHFTPPSNFMNDPNGLVYKHSPHLDSWSACSYDASACDDLSDAERAALEAPNARYRGR